MTTKTDTFYTFRSKTDDRIFLGNTGWTTDPLNSFHFYEQSAAGYWVSKACSPATLAQIELVKITVAVTVEEVLEALNG